MESEKIAIIVLGRPNSGKSKTWYELFGRTIRTGFKRLQVGAQIVALFVKNGSFEEMGGDPEIEVFVRNASFEEYGDEIEDYFDEDNLPRIVFCSVQYAEKGLRTIQWFCDNGYQLHIQWLNPGYRHSTEYQDHLEFEKTFRQFGTFSVHSGKEVVNRTEEIRHRLTGWLAERSSL